MIKSALILAVCLASVRCQSLHDTWNNATAVGMNPGSVGQELWEIWNAATPFVDVKFGSVVITYDDEIIVNRCYVSFDRVLDQEPYQYLVKFTNGTETMGYYQIFSSESSSSGNKFVCAEPEKYEVLEMFPENLYAKRNASDYILWELMLKANRWGDYNCQVVIPSTAHPRKFQ